MDPKFLYLKDSEPWTSDVASLHFCELYHRARAAGELIGRSTIAEIAIECKVDKLWH